MILNKCSLSTSNHLDALYICVCIVSFTGFCKYQHRQNGQYHKALVPFVSAVRCTFELWESVCVSLSFLNLKGKSLPFSCSSFHVVCSTTSHYATHQLKCMLSKTCRLRSKHSETYTSHTIYYLKMTHNKCGLFPFFWKRETLKETVHMTLSRSH